MLFVFLYLNSTAMKKLSFLIVIAALFSSNLGYSQSQDATSGCDDCATPWIWAPLDSRFEVNTDSSMTIYPPAGYIYVGTDDNGENQKVGGGITVSCSCSKGSGNCLPFVYKDTPGCYADGCSECSMVVGASVGGVDISFASGGFINLTEGVNFVDKGVQIPAVFKEMRELPEVDKAFEDFVNKIYKGEPIPVLIKGDDFIAAPEGYIMAVINIFGRATVIPVPITEFPEAAIGGGKASCSCTQGDCKAESAWPAPIDYCEGDCSGTCTLSTSVNKGNGQIEATYCAINYRF